MKWVKVKHASPAVQKYHLVDGTEKKLELKYTHPQQSIRISNEIGQRVFFVEKKGFWTNKTLFKNEYGVEAGKMTFEKGFHAGSIEVDGNKYHYLIHDTPAPALVIYDALSNPLLHCELNAEYKQGQDLSSLLLGLCWYLYPVVPGQTAPARKEEVKV